MPNVISLFAGCGGSSLGYQMAGFEERLAVEWDKHAATTFMRNFPRVRLFHGDIATLTSEKAFDLAGLKEGELDLLDGSPPCQGFSMAGKRLLDDHRNSLFKEYIRLLKAFRPKTLVMENVTGMVKGHMKKTYLEIMGHIREAGYVANGEILNSMYFGVPQARQRVIIVGVREDVWSGLNRRVTHPTPTHKPIPSGQALSGVKPVNFMRLKPEWEATMMWKRMSPGQNAGDVNKDGSCYNLAKLNPRRPGPTITKMLRIGKGRFLAGLLHWAEPRTLSIEELKRLQSFPDHFTFEGSMEEQWARIGNSVPPLLAKAIGEHIKENILCKWTNQNPN